MAPKEDSKKNKNKNDQSEKKKGSKEKDKKIVKKRCGPPIATGTVMAQRVLPPMVCCPPAGCSSTFRGCLPGPGCGRC